MAKDYTVSNIIYDTDGEDIDLPTTLVISVPDDILGDIDEILDYLSEEISNKTGFCHKGFKVDVELDDE
jgi:hypothetical protein